MSEKKRGEYEVLKFDKENTTQSFVTGNKAVL